MSAFVDGISGGHARVLIGDESVAVAIPVHQLPPGTREGTVLRIRFTVDQAATNARTARRPDREEYGAE